MGFFKKSVPQVPTPPPVEEPKEDLQVVETSEPEVYEEEPVKPQKVEEVVENDEEIEQSDEDREIAELEAKKLELIERKKAKEEAEREMHERQGVTQPDVSLENVLVDFETRLTKIESVLFRLR